MRRSALAPSDEGGLGTPARFAALARGSLLYPHLIDSREAKTGLRVQAGFLDSAKRAVHPWL